MSFIKCPNLLQLKHFFHSSPINTNTWKLTNFLKLNSNKTEPIVVAPEAQLQKVSECWRMLFHLSIKVCSPGIIHSSSLNFQSHIKCNSPSFTSKTSQNSNCNRILQRLVSKTGTRMSLMLQIRVLRCTKSWEKITLNQPSSRFTSLNEDLCHSKVFMPTYPSLGLWYFSDIQSSLTLTLTLTPETVLFFVPRIL